MTTLGRHAATVMLAAALSAGTLVLTSGDEPAPTSTATIVRYVTVIPEQLGPTPGAATPPGHAGVPWLGVRP